MQMQLKEDYGEAQPGWSCITSWLCVCCQMEVQATKWAAMLVKSEIRVFTIKCPVRSVVKRSPSSPKWTGEMCELSVPSNKKSRNVSSEHHEQSLFIIAT